MRAVEAFHGAEVGGRTGEYGRICEVTRVHEFPANGLVRAHAITPDFGSKLIRNQQVTRSSRVAGSKCLVESTTVDLTTKTFVHQSRFGIALEVAQERFLSAEDAVVAIPEVGGLPGRHTWLSSTRSCAVTCRPHVCSGSLRIVARRRMNVPCVCFDYAAGAPECHLQSFSSTLVPTGTSRIFASPGRRGVSPIPEGDSKMLWARCSRAD